MLGQGENTKQKMNARAGWGNKNECSGRAKKIKNECPDRAEQKKKTTKIRIPILFYELSLYVFFIFHGATGAPENGKHVGHVLAYYFEINRNQ